MVPAPLVPLTVTTWTDERDFDRLERSWTALHEASGGTPFQTFAWLRTWWRHYGEPHPARRLHILTVEDEGGSVKAVAPLFVERLRVLGVLPVTRLALIGWGRSDYLDLLVAEDSARDALAALAAELRRRRGRFDVLVMDDVPDTSPHLTLWLDALASHGLAATRVVSDHCPRVQFADTWEETEAGLPPATRGKMRRRMRQLVERHGAEFEEAGDLERLGADVDELMALHQQRWTSVGLPGVFADPRFAAFYRDAARELARHGRYRLNFLRVGGRRVAGVSGFRHRDEFHFYHGGMGDAGEASRCSPGIALHLLTMEAAFDEGVRTYDLLRGTEPYKADLGGTPLTTWRLTVPGRPGGAGRWPHLTSQVQDRVRLRLEHERHLLAERRADPAHRRRDLGRHVVSRLATDGTDLIRRLRRPW